MVAAGALALAGAGSAAKPALGVSATPRATGMLLGPGVVRQIGARNYAGPNCPGVGWNCTKATRVLQIATDGGDNIAQCTSATPVVAPGSQSCSISQQGGNNTARCIEHTNAPDATQLCMVIQTGNKNAAIVEQIIVSTHSNDESATQTAIVTQGDATGATGSNDLKLTQSVKQNTGGEGTDDPSAADEQLQDAFQSATVTQTASGSGKNNSDIDQSQKQHAHGAATQDQNGTSGATDCAPAVGASGPNVCANLAQHASNGTNTSKLNQSIDQKEQTNEANATQFQGSFSGGIDGQVHQDTTLNGPGSSTNTANQTKHQEAKAPDGAFQEQIDPVSCCGFASQFGGTNNTETIHQSADLHASEGLAAQFIDLQGTSNSDGTCTFDQHATINIDSASQTETVGPPCPYQGASIDCASANTDLVGGDNLFVIGDVVPAQPVGGGCEVFPPENQG
jgi:hypothetical protein